MNFEIEVAGIARTVRLEAVEGPRQRTGAFRVHIDDRVEDVSVRRTDLGLSIVFADGRSLDVALTETSRGEWLVQFPRVTVPVTVDGRRHSRGPAAPVGAAGLQRVVAPMPGRVVRVLVEPGEAVQARQGLVVVEAMKMENEIASPKSGRVKEIHVQDGQSIEAGRVLVSVED